jgi:5,10-methylenetetrahydromethanopterin reductase
MQLGAIAVPLPGRTAQIAQRIEEQGFASLLLTDSQNLAPEAWSCLALAAQATTTLRLGTGVTNPITRDSALTAASALTLQVESGGRAILGIGRGDSSVQRIGRESLPVAPFERYVAEVRGYLHGEAVDRDGFESRIEWQRDASQPPVPIEIAATGPRVLQVAARQADRIGLSIGADTEYLARTLDRVRRAVKQAGREVDSVKYGAWVNALICDDRAAARDEIRGIAATFARFSAFPGNDLEALPGPLQRAAGKLRKTYDMAAHTRADAKHARELDDDFLDWFAITGPLDVVVPRFEKLAALGLDFCHVVPGSAPGQLGLGAASMERVAKEVLPLVADP